MKNILLTGATGYLGTYLAEHFLNKQYHIIALALNRSEQFKFDGHKNVSVYYLNETEIAEIFSKENIDIVIHTATLYGRCGEQIIEMLKANVAINAPDIFRGDWQGFYNHIVSLYHNPQLWPMFLNIYTILDDSHKKELMELLFLRYPEIKYNLKEGNEEMAFICNNDAENIHFNCKNIFLPAFLIRLFSHITFGKTKKEYKSKWIQLKHHKKNSNFLGRLCAMEREKNELTKLDPINQQKLNIGKCITLSALLDGKVRLSPIERGKKIVRSFCIEVTNNPYVGYETSDGFIYFIALPYSCYWGYFDNNYIFHPFDDPNMMFGIPLYPQEVLKEIILLKQKKSPVLKIRKKRIMLLATWNLGHHIWQEQPGIDFLKENNMLKKIRYMYYFTDYFNMSSYLKQFNIKSKLKVNHNFTTTHILVYCTEDVFFKKTADRLLAFCKNGSDISLSQNYINVIIALRWNQRVWREENTGIAEIINSLTEKYERISFCIDGFSKPAGNGDGFNSAEKIQKDKENMCRLMENLTPQALERIHSIIGKNCIEKVKLYSEAALLIMPFGTPEHINWMSRKPVILYGPKAARDLSIILNSPVVIPDLKVDSYLISERDIIDEDCGNYSMDWHILYNAIDQKLIQILKQKALTFNGEKNE